MTTRRRPVGARLAAAAGCALLLGAGLTACSSDSSKTLSFCTDPTYPPAEFYQVQKVGTADLKRVLVGADIDIGRAVAKKLKKTAKYVDTKFDKIIPALQDKKCDAIISFINDTAQRRSQMTFVNYLGAGQDVMLKKDATPVNAVADLYGRTVSVATGTTEEDFLKAQNSSAPSGKQITIKSFASENDAILALTKDAVQVYFGDAPIVQSAVSSDNTLVQGAELVKPVPIGIALRPGDERIGPIQKAIKDMYNDGTMGKILATWKFSRYAITPS